MTYDNIKSHKKTLFRRQILIFGKVIGGGGGVHKPPSRFRVNSDLVLKNFLCKTSSKSSLIISQEKIISACTFIMC